MVVLLLLKIGNGVLLMWMRWCIVCAVNRHEIIVDKNATEQSGQRPALRRGTERYVCFKQVDLFAAFKANAEQQNEEAQAKAAGNPRFGPTLT